jgi:hypothetical protein
VYQHVIFFPNISLP